jgi:hypothetical protein
MSMKNGALGFERSERRVREKESEIAVVQRKGVLPVGEMQLR